MCCQQCIELYFLQNSPRENRRVDTGTSPISNWQQTGLAWEREPELLGRLPAPTNCIYMLDNAYHTNIQGGLVDAPASR